MIALLFLFALPFVLLPSSSITSSGAFLEEKKEPKGGQETMYGTAKHGPLSFARGKQEKGIWKRQRKEPHLEKKKEKRKRNGKGGWRARARYPPLALPPSLQKERPGGGLEEKMGRGGKGRERLFHFLFQKRKPWLGKERKGCGKEEERKKQSFLFLFPFSSLFFWGKKASGFRHWKSKMWRGGKGKNERGLRLIKPHADAPSSAKNFPLRGEAPRSLKWGCNPRRSPLPQTKWRRSLRDAIPGRKRKGRKKLRPFLIFPFLRLPFAFSLAFFSFFFFQEALRGLSPLLPLFLRKAKGFSSYSSLFLPHKGRAKRRRGKKGERKRKMLSPLLFRLMLY